MNIFDVLSQGKGKLNEENLSAMLAFLLSPAQTHGLGDIFLSHFLTAVAQSCEEEDRFSDILDIRQPLRADVLLESAYDLGAKQRVVDIEIRIFKPTSKLPNYDEDIAEVHRIAIENKIKAGSASPNQFKEEFQGIVKDLAADDLTKITMVFLTPGKDHKRFLEEYTALDEQILGSHKKSWLRWSDDKADKNDVATLIRDILKKESEAEIPPMTEYLRHTLKAFVQHLFEISKPKVTAPKDPAIWGIDQVVGVEIPKGKYRIEKFKNSTIRVVNLETQKYESAKPLLEEIIRQKNLNIKFKKTDGSEKNSRILGEEVMDELIRQGKHMKDT